MRIQSFQDIKAWQVARRLVSQVYHITSAWPYRYRSLADQINRAAVSIMANIAEGFDSSSDADFVRFLVYSRQSASEVQSHLIISRDQNLIDQKEFDALFHDTNQVKSMVIAFIQYLKKS